MSVNIKMSHHDLCVSIELSNSDESEYSVNTAGFLSTLENFLSTLDLYENVNIEIKRKAVLPVNLQTEFDFNNNTLNGSWQASSDTITVNPYPSKSFYFQTSTNPVNIGTVNTNMSA